MPTGERIKMFGSSSANYTKLKTNLRLAINRLKLLEKKKTELAQQVRREIAEQLRANKIDRARIRVEHIIREDFLIEAMEMLEMYCDLLIARMGLIQHEKKMDEGLEEAITSILWATPRLVQDVPEFGAIAREFTRKYGAKYCEGARDNHFGSVNQKLLKKLSVQAPRQTLVEQYLIEIARNFHVEYEADPRLVQELEAPLIEMGNNAPLPPTDGFNSSNNNNGGNFSGGGHLAVKFNSSLVAPPNNNNSRDPSPSSMYPSSTFYQNNNVVGFHDDYSTPTYHAATADSDDMMKKPPATNPNMSSHANPYPYPSPQYDAAGGMPNAHDIVDDDDDVPEEHAPMHPQQRSINRNSTYNLPPIDEKLMLDNPNASIASSTLRRYNKAYEAGELPRAPEPGPSAPPGSGTPSYNMPPADVNAGGHGVAAEADEIDLPNLPASDEEEDWGSKLPNIPTNDASGVNANQASSGSVGGTGNSTNLDDLMRRFERLKK